MTPLFVVTAGVALAVVAALGFALRRLQRRAAMETLDRAVFDDFDAALRRTPKPRSAPAYRTTKARAGTTA